MIFRPKPKTVPSTPISDFVRKASSRDKKRVYKVVLEKATERQQRVMREAAQRRARLCTDDAH
jgi:hypothetical protein